MLDLIKGFRNVYKYNTCFFVFHEALMNEFSHSSKLVLRRVLGSKCKKLGYNNGIGGDELFQTFRNKYSQTFEGQDKREIGLKIEGACLPSLVFRIGTINAFLQQSGKIWSLNVQIYKNN